MLFWILMIAGFLFLSHMSGLPQAMFYHLHFAVALPLAIMGFLILIPGLVREICVLFLWPRLRRLLKEIYRICRHRGAEENSVPGETTVKLTSSSSSSSFSGWFDSQHPNAWAKMIVGPEPKSTEIRRQKKRRRKQSEMSSGSDDNRSWRSVERPLPTLRTFALEDFNENYLKNSETISEMSSSAKTSGTTTTTNVSETTTTTISSSTQECGKISIPPNESANAVADTTVTRVKKRTLSPKTAKRIRKRKMEEQFEMVVRSLQPVLRSHLASRSSPVTFAQSRNVLRRRKTQSDSARINKQKNIELFLRNSE